MANFTERIVFSKNGVGVFTLTTPSMTNSRLRLRITIVLNLRVIAPEDQSAVSNLWIDRLGYISEDRSPEDLGAIRVTISLDDVANPPVAHGVDWVEDPSRAWG